MKVLLDAVQSALDAARAVSSAPEAAGMPPAELVGLAEALGLLRRAVDAAMLPVAAEIARQSRPELGRESLAKKRGFRTSGVMISTTTGTSTGEAVRMVMVGEATAPRVEAYGEVSPPKHPHVAQALNAGTIGTLAAAAIVGMLDKVKDRTDPVSLDEMESRLVEAAPGLSIDQLHTIIARAEAALDPDGIEPKEKELRADRGLTVHQERSGMVALSGRFDPETAAPILAAVEGIVSGMLRRREDGTSVLDSDERTIRQMRADALSELCRHTLGCDGIPTAASTTVVVRMSLNDLQSGTGVGSIDGIGQPVSASTIRRMAADAQLIPCVLGGDSEILDWGRRKREFTRAQKLALSERDGGCAFCGLPPSMTAAHHIRWWARDAGPTDLDNGVLLCTSCHHRIHDDGWEIRIDSGGSVPRAQASARPSVTPSRTAGFRTQAKVWFIPPAWLDAERTPRLGGRARYDLTA
jgi:5-methylcytosine-specific restriction protein A